MPKEFLDKVENPNFNLHKLKIPMRMCIVAPSGSGKTNFLCNLISVFSSGKGTFQSITIITRNKDEPLYRWIMSKCESIIVREGIENTPPLDKFDKDFNHLVCFDDLVLAKDLSKVENYYIRARKLGVSCVFLSQSFFKIPKIIRNNSSYIVLLKLSGNREVNVILSEFGLGVTKDQLLEIYKFATKEKMSPLLIDMESEPSSRFRKGLLEVIDYSNFRE
jgi:ABC-type dipeptide/oligopeptide/nickel transport system ATPase component